ncbi:RNA polymerase sigma factor [Salinivirga cyanobacteriivorans]|uniref:RNA polymerase sigma factor n=1 Tax=Salinivirga cyanobacteriivorans TaxID=1307839 RepID=A0A0S2HZT7_9BACT|nr:ECF-type sigma factor [Salinivirga cyanobacteriivorans]ALO15536.1 RNA polymerase sigma factor [Salinivirga cyanobacteriivorans]
MGQANITSLLNNYRKGREGADNELYSAVYSELKKTARSVRRQWNGNATMNTTSLVHEAYLKIDPEKVDWQNRLHFFYIAGKAMRQILYNYAEKKKALKRGAANKQSMDTKEEGIIIALDEKSFFEIYSLENILKQLEKHDNVYGKIIECRFYSGMTIEETSLVLEISKATVKRKWNFARTWLYRELKRTS